MFFRLCSQGRSDGNHSNNEEHIIKFGSIIEYCNACTSQPGFSSSHAHHQPSAAGSPLPQSRPDYQTRTRILDPRCVFVQKLNRVLLLARGIALAVDPLFFYVFSLYAAPGRGGAPCVYMDTELALIVTVIRTCVDIVHLWHLWLQFRLAYVSRESLVVGCGKLVWDARAIARHYVMSPTKFWLDVFVILPIPQVAGGCWYALATQRIVTCLQQQCENSKSCDFPVSCSKVYHKSQFPLALMVGKSSCLDDDGPYRYGIYAAALPVISSNSTADTILYPIFWGLLNLSSFGNELEPTSNVLEVMFSICIVLCGLTLFTLLVGNIQVSLQVVMARRKKIQLRSRDMEWWMRRRQLTSGLKWRVRHFERQRWATMGEDELDWIEDLPQGLRRDIKRYLCLDLVKKVPLFHCLDDLVLDNICDRVKALIYSKDEKIIREGNPVSRMVFLVRGRIKRSQSLSKGKLATSVLGPGGFLGDELLSWCLRRPFKDRLPASPATFTCMESVEAYGLNASDLRYIADHFRYKLADERLKRITRYYSSNWRTWAAVNIQFAWRRYRIRIRGGTAENVSHVMGNEIEGIERRLRRYAAMFMSIRPHDHLE
ncbi:cyclic nucleotide-gated ion channel 2 [Citrus sinensis]|uniref:Cyclic nucleotide-gated ion channel 2 n=1 Tax=Citrus sinensis TaxID=2711 RepID=A0ACB8K700_CITSI|nr:cyclic nucleotide-gated ion channel 2 [Citrus sinensis]